MAGIQFAGLMTTVAISIVGGLLTGLIIKIPFISTMDPSEYFHDERDWEIDAGLFLEKNINESTSTV